MTVHLSVAEMTSLVGSVLWPLIRIAGIFAAAPVLGSNLLPVRVRAALAVLITLAVAPSLPPVPALDPLSPAALVVGFQQVLIGLAIGFLLQLLIGALVIAAEQISMTMGLGLAQMTDPQNGTPVPVLGQLYVVLGTLLFLALDGHLALIRLIAQSFHVLPVGPVGISRPDLLALLAFAGQMFVAALRIALPTLVVLLCANVAMGMITRSAPQMNLFSIGLPVTTLLGLVTVWAVLDQTAARFLAELEGVMALAQAILVP